MQQPLIEETKANGWVGMVRVGGSYYAVLPESSAPGGGPDPGGDNRRTVTQAITKLGFRKTEHFGPNYDRMGIEVMMAICGTYDNVEQYVNLNYTTMKEDARAGIRAQY